VTLVYQFPRSYSNLLIFLSERIPLLARSPLNGYQAPSAALHASVSPIVGPSTSWTTSNTLGRLIDLGWIEYNLPDGTTYYSHMTKKLTTDLNLRSERILNAVTLWMEERENESTGYDMEGWLKESTDKNIKKKKSGWGGRKNKKEDDLVFLERYWVDHHRRSVYKDGEVVGYGRNHAYTNGHGYHGKGKKQAHASKVTEEDRMLIFIYYGIASDILFPRSRLGVPLLGLHGGPSCTPTRVSQSQGGIS